MAEAKTTKRRTKAEMTEEYDKIREKVEDAGMSPPADRDEEKALVSRASSSTIDSIVKGMAELNLTIGRALGELTEKMTIEARRLQELQKAIEIEEKRLEEVRQIKIVADSLALLVEEHEETKKRHHQEMESEKAAFERMLKEAREEWKKEQALHEAAVKERDTKIAREREREKEEYEYTKERTRTKEKDSYELQKAALERALKEERENQEKELSERESALKAREEEYAELKKKVDTSQAALDDAVKKAVREATQKAEEKAAIEAKLTAKEIQGEKSLMELQIKNLQEVVKRHENEIASLSKQLAEANRQVMTIATQAIEGASGAKTLNTVQEIAMEQARLGKGSPKQ